jgi:type III secretory pathway lipoprotein EscJ
VPIYADVVVLSRSRALAQVFVASGLVAPSRAEEIRLARLVAGRMARAMRR